MGLTASQQACTPNGASAPGLAVSHILGSVKRPKYPVTPVFPVMIRPPEKSNNSSQNNEEETNNSMQTSQIRFPMHCKLSKVFIFDLDDTLIPTEWIRSNYMLVRDEFGDGMDLYQSVMRKINAETNHGLTPTIAQALRKATEISDTVAVVTNARSVKWLSIFQSLFPDIVQLMVELNIPLIRSCPTGREPSIHCCTEYFLYWMNAKKVRFHDIVRNHFQKLPEGFDKKIDIVSIGDNDFEEYAARDLALQIPNVVRQVQIIRCKPGLRPEKFMMQLQDIVTAIDLTLLENVSDLKSIGNSVMYSVFGSGRS